MRLATSLALATALSAFFNGNFGQRKISFWRAGGAFRSVGLPLLAPPKLLTYPPVFPSGYPETRSTAVAFIVNGAAVDNERQGRAHSTAPPWT